MDQIDDQVDRLLLNYSVKNNCAGAHTRALLMVEGVPTITKWDCEQKLCAVPDLAKLINDNDTSLIDAQEIKLHLVPQQSGDRRLLVWCASKLGATPDMIAKMLLPQKLLKAKQAIELRTGQPVVVMIPDFSK